MSERSGSHRTTRGRELEREHQARYEKWWLGKYLVLQGEVAGKIVAVKYHGNSVYGFVHLTLDDGRVHSPYTTSFRPRKSDVEIQEAAA